MAPSDDNPAALAISFVFTFPYPRSENIFTQASNIRSFVSCRVSILISICVMPDLFQYCATRKANRQMWGGVEAVSHRTGGAGSSSPASGVRRSNYR
jgi:hypothetical protein